MVMVSYNIDRIYIELVRDESESEIKNKRENKYYIIGTTWPKPHKVFIISIAKMFSTIYYLQNKK